MKVRLLTEPEIRALVGPADALPAVRDAFVALARGQAVLPNPSDLDLAEVRGDMHVKGAWMRGAPYFSFKAASGFYDNPGLGLPVNAGLVMVFDARTGFPVGILFDNGYLTDLRTGAAGALAADLLARPSVGAAAVLGAGVQARRQLEALALVRRPERVLVWGRNPEAAERCAAEVGAALGVPATVAATAREAVEGADVVVTATPARAPILESAWVRPGTHVTAVGADLPGKQELDPALLARADKVVADRLSQALSSGEIHHAVEAGLIAPADVHAELGEIAAGLKPGRERDDEITVADLTGVGIQDAAMANLTMVLASEAGAGREVEV